MLDRGQPLVSVVTPVFNGEAYLAECLESVLAQDYRNWEHIVADNGSTDDTAGIALAYAERDPRIRLVRSAEHLPVIPSWNRALRQISEESDYCKVLHADDELLPGCLARMVELAERHPDVGVVGAYTVSGARVKLDGVPYPREVVPGPEICRATLLGGPYVFGSPTALLLRSELVRVRDPFYDEEEFHADMAVCFELLRGCDFGFVHQVLTHTREHRDSLTSRVAGKLYTYKITQLALLKRHGPVFLEPEEYRERLAEALADHYRFLAKRVLRRRRDRKFWTLHREGLARIGEPLRRGRLAREWIRFLGRRLASPAATLRGRLRARRPGGEEA